MATQTKQPQPPEAAGYDQDFYLWCHRMAELIRAGRFEEVDRENLAEEIEDLARRTLTELKSRTRTLLAHLLKRDYQPQKHTRFWDDTIYEQRDEIEDSIKDVPSLRRQLPDLIHGQYERAVKNALRETGPSREAFPATCPYTVVEVYGDWVQQ